MATYAIDTLFDGDNPGPWGEPLEIAYTERDVLLYAVGIGCADLRFVYEQHPHFAVFPTFAIRWGSRGHEIDQKLLPNSPGPMMLDAERHMEMLAPLPLAGTVGLRSRLIAATPRGKGNAFVEKESEVIDAGGRVCVRMISGSYRRGVEKLGDIEPFTARGRSHSSRIDMPERTPDFELTADIAANQPHIYRLSGDYNPLHIDPAAAAIGGFRAPILHGLCTLGHCAQLLLSKLCGDDPARFKSLKLRFSSPVYPGDRLAVRAWHEGAGKVVYEARVGDKVVVSNGAFTFATA